MFSFAKPYFLLCPVLPFLLRSQAVPPKIPSTLKNTPNLAKSHTADKRNIIDRVDYLSKSRYKLKPQNVWQKTHT